MRDALTREQREAVESDAPALQIAAGAGTGKTHTLAHRVARLVGEGAVAGRILVVTFTREATASLARRIGILLGKEHGVDVRSFHSYAARELKDQGLRFLDASDARRLARRAARPLLATFPQATREGADDPVERFLSFVSYCKNREVSPARAIRERHLHLTKHADLASEAYEEYVSGQQGRLDFDDLLVALRDRLRDDVTFRERVQARLDHLLVDEYQDVNGVQHEIVLHLARPARAGARAPHVTVVGDERQAIYGFRGGDAALLAGFATAFPDGARLALTRNFRSRAPLLDHANRLFPHLDALAPALPGLGGALPRAVACPTPQKEAEFVLDDAARLIEGGNEPEDIAVLYRSRHLADALEEAIRERAAKARKLTSRARRAEREALEALARVTRSTIHGAKGLEWDHVYLIGTREGGIPASAGGRVDAASAGDLLAEERRLFYVAATRARLTFTATWPERDRGRATRSSRFLAEYFEPPASPPASAGREAARA